jgi:hypothetical protein
MKRGLTVVLVALAAAGGGWLIRGRVPAAPVTAAAPISTPTAAPGPEPVSAPAVRPPDAAPSPAPTVRGSALERPARAGDQERSLRALEGAFARRSAREATLFARFERAGLMAPSQAEELVRMDQAGSPAPALEAFVRESFPADIRVRLVAIEWIRGRTMAAPAPSVPEAGAVQTPGWISSKRP